MKKKKLFFNKKSQLVFAESMMITCGCMLLGVPLIGSGFGSGDSYYEVTLAGKTVGSVKNPSVVENAYLQARARISRETDGLVLADVEYELDKVPKIFGSTMDSDTLSDAFYKELTQIVAKAKKKAYLMKINEFTVTLGSYQDVMDVLYATKDRFDTDNEFQINIVSDAARELNVYTVEVSKQNTAEETAAEVAKLGGIAGVGEACAGIGEYDVSQAVESVITKTVTEEDVAEENAADNAEQQVEGDGLRSVDFAEKVEIAEAYVSADEITPTDEAIDLVTKDTAKNEIYEVRSGDTLSVIANSNGLRVAEVLALNEGMSENTVLHEGDEIIITVPEPELSVETVEESTYQEEYYAEVQYIDNDEWYTTKTEVRQEEQAGYHEVTALITKKNGAEENRDVISETVLQEPVPKIVERGTQTPPTYVKPISGGRFTSGFKRRWGRMHKGVDWACPIGTAVMASCGGTVVQAGWFSGYGNCITIRHPDGKQTRYGHLSKILVSSGQKVTQGQKIALSGNTGRSTGPHVHFEIIINGSQVNPLPYLN
ncbi:M23 family metallopeptidase [Laedolimicola ammoniilytica]|uniref:Peptidoglycan DD-metalloendopeptidase family protein n=1 Tax=Laedolimicola ammoniilytica TaxID=2981771 RepID=A0ABT2S1A3_9FIRM|nr:M23 family metallopeptidase [Laedolimicola ammoniilytica]MCU6698172.1 peptidoglycan DD-metalloendopeptidase family protein [Laedolimicola ammoniilytica]SCI66729.1 Glycyl-glycine endopeptidase lytM precursor [uncultured Clostridium sp.]